MIEASVLKSLGVSADNIDKYLPWLNMTMLKYDITTPVRQAMFLSQLAHESGNFRHVSENLNYSVGALRKVFGKYFPTDDLAAQYARQPEKIANRVYANRMGNGDEASGDGWKYRGRGLIQLTGKNNYTAFSLAADNNALLEPELVSEPELAVQSAGWFWDTNGLNRLADTGSVKRVTRRINGGYNGLEDREAKFGKLMILLGDA
ncbi:MAG TPA: glycoside hydrolase family 19 protein [Candidatus Paceibacterota bacterium]|nr:glycoside hydrolase family 19 protein [Candidatus Paceibacterota bacterium]